MKAFFERLRAHRLPSIFVLLAMVSAAIVAGSFAAHGVYGKEQQNPSSDATPLKVVNSTVPPNAFVKIAQEVGPAVVNINTETLPKNTGNSDNGGVHSFFWQAPQQPGGENDQQGPDNFQDFFNRFFGGQMPGMQGGEDEQQVRESLGSGFIVDPKGYIITNYHVIAKADKIYVKLASDPDTADMGRPAHVIGYDKATDLAVIKIDTNTPLPTVQLGNSDNVHVGDWVEAIGSPFALAQTVTAGIISAKNRTIEPGASGEFQHFLQTDAAINPGNSGGPLLNMDGQVIGVNTAIYTQSGGYQGLGFAMPSNTVVAVYNDLIGPSHKVTRGSIGIEFRENLPQAVNRIYGFKYGVLVQQVEPGQPADKAGIKPGDIIVSIDGRPIKDGDDLVNDIASRKPGSTIRLGYLRNGQHEDTTVTIGNRDQVFASLNGQPSAPATGQASDAGEARLGVVVRNASSAVLARLHTPGVVIQSVRAGSFADLQGLEPGLVITRVNRQPTPDKEQFDAVVGKLKTGDDVVFEVLDPRHPNDGINYLGGTLQ
ncbi:MAG: trypsin-like peptidase domain-containing protein [Terracidiphilus sp.]